MTPVRSEVELHVSKLLGDLSGFTGTKPVFYFSYGQIINRMNHLWVKKEATQKHFLVV